MAIKLLTLLWTTAFFLGCTVDESKRCAGEYQWSEDLRLCVIVTDDTDSDTALEERDTQANGVGARCYEDADCADYEAQLCLYNPQDPGGPSICSVWDCLPEDCTGPYSCCDCTSVQTELLETDAPFCIPNDQVPTITTVFTCVCE